jgi:hypothetical protein
MERSSFQDLPLRVMKRMGWNREGARLAVSGAYDGRAGEARSSAGEACAGLGEERAWLSVRHMVVAGQEQGQVSLRDVMVAGEQRDWLLVGHMWRRGRSAVKRR